MMNRIRSFALILAVSAAALVVILWWYLQGFQSGNGSVSGMMGQMMGGQYGGGTMQAMPLYVWGGVVFLILLVLVAVVGMGYYAAVPEIRRAPSPKAPQVTVPPAKTRPTEDWAVLVRTSKPEERKVLEVLAAHNGTYLQKFIVKESGLSRLKTHRIISRLVERGVVMAVQSGNTNEITIASWLERPTPATSP